MKITVLRLGHRPERDKRITTHVCLTARALGAQRVVIHERDDRIVDGVRDIAKRFGGQFEVESGVPFKPLLKGFQGTKVHLTMYGLPLQEVVPQIPRDKDLLVVVGAEKVPREVYDLSDFNVAVGNQPHSEVAALAILLYALQGEAALAHSFDGGEMQVEPSARGKIVRSFAGNDASPDEAEDDGS